METDQRGVPDRVQNGLALHRAIFSSVLVALCVVAAGCGGSGERSAAPAPLRIERLSGSVAKLGSFNGYPLYGVRLRATVCTGSNDAEIYPDFTIAHYLLAGSPTRKWTLVRKVFDRPPYLVPLQETWQGRRCGPAQVDDPIPPDHTGGVEQLGNPWSCYGVALTIWAGKRHATKRAAIQCGGIGGTATCVPAKLATPPWVVGLRRPAAVERLRAAGFRPFVNHAEKPKRGVPAGIVLEQEPERGFRLCRRADIDLIVSV
jgi:hypothetical protein